MMEDEQPTVDCFVNSCEGRMQVLLDGTAVCQECGLVERQWTEPRPDEPASNAKEFSGYVGNIAEYIHADFEEWYEDYIKLLDVYYKRQRGWPSEDAKLKFHDLYMIAPIKFVQLMEERNKQIENQVKQAQRDMADKVNRRRNGGV
jgi:hypothetical protein